MHLGCATKPECGCLPDGQAVVHTLCYRHRDHRGLTIQKPQERVTALDSDAVCLQHLPEETTHRSLKIAARQAITAFDATRIEAAWVAGHPVPRCAVPTVLRRESVAPRWC